MARTLSIKRAVLVAFALSLITAAGPLSASEEPSSPSAADALRWLKEGNQRFVSQTAEHPHQTRERREHTAAAGQKPFAALLSCSDSRVPPEMIFDRGIGDLFVMRVAGNIADEDEIGTAEYAAEHLHTPLLVVMGHTRCGAVTAAATRAETSGKIAGLIQKIMPAVGEPETEDSSLSEDARVNAAVEANVRHTMDVMLAQSPVLRRKAGNKSLVIVGAVYDISTGIVTWLDR